MAALAAAGTESETAGADEAVMEMLLDMEK